MAVGPVSVALSSGPKIGLLGGSFDPVHQAHLALAQAALAHCGLDQVQFIPAAAPWQRKPLSASPAHRLAMLHLALLDQPGLSINSIEIERGGPTYTIDTVRALPAGASYYWILGADQLANFCTWHKWREIARSVRLLVAQRPGTPLTPPPELARQLSQDGLALLELPFPAMPVSASDIRIRLAEGAPTDGQLHPAVADYIARHGLYRPSPASPAGL